MHFRVVLFPEPFGPSKPYTSPSRTWRFNRSSARNWPRRQPRLYFLVRFSVRIASMLISNLESCKFTAGRLPLYVLPVDVAPELRLADSLQERLRLRFVRFRHQFNPAIGLVADKTG